MQNQGRPKFFRTRLLIFPKFQLRLLGANLGVILLVSALLWYQMNRAFSDLTATAGLSGDEAAYYKRYLEFQAHHLNMSLLGALVTAVLVSTILTLVLSHRFSGPLIRLRRFFTEISQGQAPVPRLQFRKNDFLDDLPPLVNQAIDTIQKKAS